MSALVGTPERQRSARRMAASSALLLVGLSASGMVPAVGLMDTAARPILTSLPHEVKPMMMAAPAASPERGSNEPSAQAVSLRSGSSRRPGRRDRA
eukprot:5442214-Alexandrium_andersonii.AAC.1